MNLRLELKNFRSKGVTLRANYTWSHAIDNLSNTFSETASSPNLGFLDPMNPNLDRGDADFDVRQRFTIAGMWDIPYGSSKNRIVKEIVGGWSVIPSISVRTGTPFSIWDCTNAGYVLCPRAMYSTPFQPAYTVTPTANPNQFNYLSVGTPDSSYVNPLAGVSDFGPYPSNMTARNSFRTPGAWNVDLSIHKNFALTERFKLQFRAEAFNVFNHSNLYIVYANTDLSATNYITATRGVRGDNNGLTASTENRNLQLAMKLLF